MFIVAGLFGLALTIVALMSPPFRHLSDAYAAAPVSPPDAAQPSPDAEGVSPTDAAGTERPAQLPPTAPEPAPRPGTLEP